MPSVSFQAPNDYSIEAQNIERQRKYAELLQQQALTPLGPTEMAGQFAVKRSPWEGIAKLVQAGVGAYKSSKADEMQKALAARLSQDRSSDFSTLAQSMQGRPATPERPAMQDPQEIAQQADYGTQPPPNIPAQTAIAPGQMNPEMLGRLKTPEAQAMAFKMWQDSQKPMTLGRTLVRPTGEVLATDSTWQKEQDMAREARVAAAGAAADEKAAAQARQQDFLSAQARESAKERAAQAENQARLVAGLRPPHEPAITQVRIIDNDPKSPYFGKPVVADGRTGKVLGLDSGLDVGAQTAKAGAVAGGAAEGKRAFNMEGIGSVIKEAEDLLTGPVKPTGSGIGSAYDYVASLAGKSPSGAVESAKLKSVSGALVSKMPRMEGPQSDKDVMLYKEMAGKIGDSTVPVEQRVAALDTVKGLWSKYEKQNPGAFPARRAADKKSILDQADAILGR